MPELPEVETIRRGLHKTIVGKQIVDFDSLDSKVVQIKNEQIIGARINDIERRAKIIIVQLNNDESLLFHMKMTGQLIWESKMGDKEFQLRNRRGGGHPDKTWLEKLPNKHTRAIFYFNDKSVLYFNDIRKFAWVKIAKTSDLKYHNPLNHIGAEPLSDEFTVKYLLEKAKRFPNRKIKQFIMDQSIIAGIGNIYADEALFEAKIHPLRPASKIKKEEWVKLITAIKNVLEKGIFYGGSSSENFVDAYGKQGRAHEYLKVYQKTGQQCPIRCGGKIERIIVGGRGTHFCPKCQK